MNRLSLDDGSYSSWMTEHFEFKMAEGIICKRCGLVVDYLTLHARNAHEDDINVLPVRSDGFFNEVGQKIVPPGWRSETEE